jgi:hypothetical protein
MPATARTGHRRLATQFRRPPRKKSAGGSIEDRRSEMTGLGVGHLPGLKSPGVNTVFLLE